MNKTFILFVAVLVASASCNSMLEKYSFAFKSRRSIMTVMAQIESTIKTGGPMDAITNILDQFEDEIKAEQVAHQELYEKQSGECDTEFEFRRQQIGEANDAIHEASNSLESCIGQKQRAQTDLKSSENQLANARQSLGTLERKKISYDYHYETFSTSSKMALEAFPEIYRLVDELVNGGENFLQLTSHVTNMVPHVAKVGAMKSMNPVLSALATMTTNISNNDKVFFDKIKGVVEGFEHDVRAEIQKRADENAKFQNEYNITKAKLKSEIARLEQLIEDLTAEIHQLQQCITVQTTNLHQANEKFRRNSTLLEKAEAMCHSMAEQFEKATVARRDELELLAAIKVKVEERYAQISKGATERGEMSAEEL